MDYVISSSSSSSFFPDNIDIINLCFFNTLRIEPDNTLISRRELPLSSKCRRISDFRCLDKLIRNIRLSINVNYTVLQFVASFLSFFFLSSLSLAAYAT